MNGPEQIWAHPSERNPVNKVWQRGKWKDHDSGSSGDAEYIREDAVAEMIRQAVKAELNACAKLVDANAQVFSDVIYINPANEKVFGEHERLLRSIAELIRARGDT